MSFGKDIIAGIEVCASGRSLYCCGDLRVLDSNGYLVGCIELLRYDGVGFGGLVSDIGIYLFGGGM